VTRIAVLGGSAVSTPQLTSALVDAGCSDVQLALIARSAEKLALVAAACRRVSGDSLSVSTYTSLEPGLMGADVILSQVRVGGLEGRSFDEQFARDLGIPGEETVGPGGFALAWRTLPVVRDLLERCRRLAPEALLLNLTNPASMVHQLASRYLQTLTLCDAPVVLARQAAALVGAGSRTVTPRYLGLNHCGWITALEIGGRDLLGDVLGRRQELAQLTGIDEEVLAWMQAIPNPYLRYLYHPDRQLSLQLEKPGVRADELAGLEGQALADYAQPDADLAVVASRRPAPWYAECVVPLIRSLADRQPVRAIINVTNGTLVPFLPAEAAVEVAADVAQRDAVPLPPDSLPADARALLQSVAAFNVLATEAILLGDREGCVRALTSHPLVGSVAVARELVSRIERRFGPLAGGAA
jgi:6-phospho-beta-glucosidase